MSRRRSTVTYKAGEELVHDRIWVQAIKPEDIQGNTILLKLFREQDGEAVLTQNNDGELQYQVSLPIQDGAYAYIPINAMKALVAMNSVRTLDDETWVQLVLDPIQPSMRDFSKAQSISDI